jgi:hypothetical protein
MYIIQMKENSYSPVDLRYNQHKFMSELLKRKRVTNVKVINRKEKKMMTFFHCFIDVLSS